LRERIRERRENPHVEITLLLLSSLLDLRRRGALNEIRGMKEFSLTLSLSLSLVRLTGPAGQ